MLLYAMGAITVAESTYCGWQCYNFAKHSPQLAPIALRYGAFGTLAPIIYYAPFFATASMISTFSDKVLKDYKPQGPLGGAITYSVGQALGGVSGFLVTNFLGKPWDRVSNLAAKYLADSLT